MRRVNAIVVLSAVALLLVAALVWAWVDPAGNVRNTNWVPPAPIKPDLSGYSTQMTPPENPDISRFIATLERPLFSPTRKPPPKVVEPAVAQAPPPDPLAGIHIFGLFGWESGGGMLARIEGKVRRVTLNDTFGGWTLKSISGREAVVERGGESRTLKLEQARVPQPKAARPEGTPEQPLASPQATSPGASAVEQAQIREEAARERIRRRNELRSRAGARPITQ